MLRYPAEQVARGAVDVDEAEPLAGYVVVGVSVLLGVGDEHAIADRLDPEWPVTAGNRRVDESAVGHEIEAPIEDVHAGVVEVGRVEPGSRGRICDRETLVDGAQV